MNRYRGKCIGGVADGRVIGSDDVEIKIQKMMRQNEPALAGAKPDLELDFTIYKFLLLLGNSNTEIGVWVPNHIQVEQVIERLINCYDPRVVLIGRGLPTLPIKQG